VEITISIVRVWRELICTTTCRGADDHGRLAWRAAFPGPSAAADEGPGAPGDLRATKYSDA